jgi:uncharacterized protein
VRRASAAFTFRARGSLVFTAGSILALFAALFFVAHAAEVIPPVPNRYFNDYAGVVSPAVANELNTRLETFEKETSNQILVAIFPKMQSDSSVQDYTVRVAQAWRVGQKEKRNGAVLFLFIQDRQMFLQVGYGLEGALPDALAKQITEFEIKPRLQRGDYDGALRAGVDAIIKATRGEYKGTGRTLAQRGVGGSGVPTWFWIGAAIIIFLGLSRRRRRGRVYHRGGWGGWGVGGWGGGWGGSSGGGWSSSSSGGGTFSAGGGDFGGGGAGSSW